jgi:type III pantothenate kinase
LAVLALKSRGHERGIVVDIGTACTIDVLEKNRHVGGFILPGPKLACDTLVSNTDKIRYSTEPPAALEPGTDTGACVVSGAWLTIVGAVKEIALRYPHCPVFLAGGAAPTLLHLGVDGELVTDLVFDGLYFWLNGA